MPVEGSSDVDFGPQRKPLLALNPVSLTDIVFLLLIFFLLSSSFVMQPGIKVHLPRAAPAEASLEDRITVTIAGPGRVFLDGDLVAVGELPSRVQRLLRGRDPTAVVVVRAERDTQLELVVQVMDMCRRGGATRFLIATQPVPEQG
jgi:biopolymer transport protein ExbD